MNTGNYLPCDDTTQTPSTTTRPLRKLMILSIGTLVGASAGAISAVALLGHSLLEPEGPGLLGSNFNDLGRLIAVGWTIFIASAGFLAALTFLLCEKRFANQKNQAVLGPDEYLLKWNGK